MWNVNLLAVEPTALILVGALAYLSAAFFHARLKGRTPARQAEPFRSKGPQLLVEIYLSAGLLLPFLNGYVLRRSWADCLVIGFGTLIAALVGGALIHKPKGAGVMVLFYPCAAATVLWPIVGVARAVAGLSG